MNLAQRPINQGFAGAIRWCKSLQNTQMRQQSSALSASTWPAICAMQTVQRCPVFGIQ